MNTYLWIAYGLGFLIYGIFLLVCLRYRRKR